MRRTRWAVPFLLVAALLPAACGSGGGAGAEAAASAGSEAPRTKDGWGVLADGARVYARLGEIRFELEHRCMEQKGFTTHPTLAAGAGDWAPISREAPVLSPTVEQAGQTGFSSAEPKPMEEYANPEWAAQSEGYRTGYKDAYDGDGGCLASVHWGLYGVGPGPDPIPLPDSFDWSARWEMYYAMPDVVTAVTSWRACMREAGEDVGLKTPQDLAGSAGELSPKAARKLAEKSAACVDRANWRPIHEISWSTAMDRLVREEEDAIRTWLEDLNRVLDDAEDLLAG